MLSETPPSPNKYVYWTFSGENSHSVALKLIAASQDFECSQNKLLEKSEASVVAAMKNIYFMAKFNLTNSLFGELNKHCIDQVINFN